MSFDMDQVMQEMAGVINEAGKQAEGDVKTYSKTVLEKHRKSLQELGEARLRGDIKTRVFERELAREKLVLEAEMLALKIIGKAAMQKAVNGAIAVFVKAVKAAL